MQRFLIIEGGNPDLKSQKTSKCNQSLQNQLTWLKFTEPA